MFQKKPNLILPFVNELAKRKCQSALRRAGLQDQLRLTFRSRTLASHLSHKRKPNLCPKDCPTCLASKTPGQCFVKNVVYLVKCRLCAAEYVGETGRTIRSRIIEHCTRSSSAVFQHLIGHGDVTTSSIEWTIVHRGLPFQTL